MDIFKYKLTCKGSLLSEEERRIFLEKYKLIENRINCKKIYRGENKPKLFKLYLCNDFTSFSHSLFLIGNKGRFFIAKAGEKVKDKTKWRLDNVKKEVYKNIFKIIGTILNKRDSVVDHFIKSNNKLAEYFGDENNLDVFIQSISVLGDIDKIKIRDYYLTLIHQFEDEYFYPVSSLLSVTTEFDVAKGFSGSNNDKIILFGWIPYNRQNEKYEITYDYLNLTEKKLIKNNLPFYNESFYPGEIEISLKGGLLPHYLIGYLYLDWKSQLCFDVNPNFFSLNGKSDYWIDDGLPIDQSGFWDELKKTNFEASFWVNWKGDYWDENK